jgi:hypothetical protein
VNVIVREVMRRRDVPLLLPYIHLIPDPSLARSQQDHHVIAVAVVVTPLLLVVQYQRRP